MKSVQATKQEDKVKYKAIYNQILSDLKSRKIHSNEDYHYRDFSRKYQINNLFMSEKHTESNTSTQLINEASADPTETTTENSIFNIILEASNEPIEAPAAEALNSNVVGLFLSENTQHNNRFVDCTELRRPWQQTQVNFAERKEEEKEHLKNTMQEMRESNISMLTPLKQANNDGEVSFCFGQRQNILEHNIRILNSNDTAEPNLPLSGFTDHTSPPRSSLRSAAITVGFVATGVWLAALAGAVYYLEKIRGGSYDVEKAA